MDKFPRPITKQCIGKIMEQINYPIYKLDEKNSKFICFFCHIKYRNENIPVLITTYQIINEEYLVNNNSIDILIDNKKVKIYFEKAKYLNKSLDISIVEIKDINKKLIKFFELDESLYKKSPELFYHKETIYIIHCNKFKNNNYVSFGIINDINNSQLICSCNINSNSICSPIFNANNNKLIGIYRYNSNHYAKGIFLKLLIKKFIKEYNYSKKEIDDLNDIKNEISITINVNKEDINKKVYFLQQNDCQNDIMPERNSKNDNSKELNEINTEIYIDKIKQEYKRYFIPEKEGKYTINLKIKINLLDCSYMFARCKNIIDINFISFNTKYVTNMKYMFYECGNLKKINLFSFNTKNVLDMSYMFHDCYKLKSLDLSSFNTKKVKDMNNMFNHCKNLSNLNISLFKTKNVQNMNFMFLDCWKLNDIDISFLKTIDEDELNNIYFNRWDKNKLFSIDSEDKSMFNEIYILLNIDKEDISKKIYFLNNSDKSLEELNENNTELYINKRKQVYAKYFIPEKEGEYEINIKFNIYLRECSFMFSECSNIIYINFIAFNTYYITSMCGMFNKCHSLNSLNLSSFETKYVENMSGMFNECYNLKKLDLSSFNTGYATNMGGMFNRCCNLKSLDLTSFNTTYVTDMNNMFNKCYNLQNINLSSFYTENVTDMKGMFQDCNNLKNLDLSSFNTKNVIEMNNMFNKCYNLTSLDLSSFNTEKVNNMYAMFNGCKKIKYLDLSSFDTQNVTDMGCMFSECNSLEKLDLSSFETTNVNNMEGMFQKCYNLNKLDISSFDSSNVNNMDNIFSECYKLKDKDLF